jgi:hypothetical protein
VNSTEKLTLTWSELIPIDQITYDNPQEAGVYVWGFYIDTVFIPYYVGIGTNIVHRIHQHINAIIGGLYTIHHKDTLADFEKYKNEGIQEDRGILYIPDWPKGYKTFLENRKKLQPHIDFMIDRFVFSYATVDGDVVLQKGLSHVEKICIEHMGLKNLANTRSGFSNKYQIEHYGSAVVVDKFQYTRSVNLVAK